MRKYLGEFKNDMKSGFGKVWYPNGDVYAGQFKSDKRSGFGMYLYCEQVPALGYLGYHQDDLYHGIGKISFENSSHYLGAFSFGKMKADSGRFEFENGDVYEGPIQNSKKSQTGKYTYSSGDEYKGEFHNDLKHGFGEMTMFQKKIKYIGDFRDDYKTGPGKVELEDCEIEAIFDENERIQREANITYDIQVYEGQMKNSTINGMGKIQYLDSANVYEGQFFDNQKDGPGKFFVHGEPKEDEEGNRVPLSELDIKERQSKKPFVFEGEFRFGIEQSQVSNYGPRI